LTTSVIATEAAEIESRWRNSKKIAKSVVNGFFNFTRSEISQQVSELTTRVDATLIHLSELSKSVLDKKRQMEVDFNRISSRYVKVFEDLDKETALNIYTFLSKQQSVLHLNKIDLEKVKEIVLQKYENVHLYKLNPSLNDLFNNNVYKLYIDAKLYIVPLWHNELYFDGSGCEIIVICEPDLPKNIKIDEDNNIYVEIKLSAYQELCAKIINQSSIEVDVGNNVFNIPISELYMKKEQYYKIKGKGISKIKNDIYDITEKADIIVKMVIF